VVRLDPRKAPDRGDRRTWKERFLALRHAGWITGIIVVTIGGIYAGILSAVEAAGVGAFLAGAVAVGRRALTRKAASDVVKATMSATGTAFLILAGAFVFKVFMGHTGTLFVVSEWIDGRNFSAIQVVAVVLALSVLLGTFLDGFAILVLMVPLCQPILESLGVDMIWFGVLIVITLEMGLISPPVGLNVFAVQSVARDVPLATVFRGIWPFWLAMLSAVLVIALFPQLATLLPALFYG
jgi:tripartite ATP-independent transporter DctM subunit